MLYLWHFTVEVLRVNLKVFIEFCFDLWVILYDFLLNIQVLRIGEEILSTYGS